MLKRTFLYTYIRNMYIYIFYMHAISAKLYAKKIKSSLKVPTIEKLSSNFSNTQLLHWICKHLYANTL